MVNKIALFAAAVAVVNVAVFYLAPAESFSLSLSDFQLQDLLLFQFAHFSVFHLFENLVGLMLTAALAIELDVSMKKFMFAYFLGAFVSVPLLLMFPGAAIAGNSTAIFGALAISLDRARGMISYKITYPLVTLFILGVSIVNSFEAGQLIAVRSDIFHIAGFAAGAGATLSIKELHI